MLRRLLQTTSDKSIILIRLLVGCVFLSEGIQKILFDEMQGAGRFQEIGLPAPHFFGPFVGKVEICCGILILIGLLTRLASIPFVVIILVALVTTKFDIYLDKGFWEVLHASRTDWSMLLGSIFLFTKGGGYFSLDHDILKNEVATPKY